MAALSETIGGDLRRRLAAAQVRKRGTVVRRSDQGRRTYGFSIAAPFLNGLAARRSGRPEGGGDSDGSIGRWGARTATQGLGTSPLVSSLPAQGTRPDAVRMRRSGRPQVAGLRPRSHRLRLGLPPAVVLNAPRHAPPHRRMRSMAPVPIVPPSTPWPLNAEGRSSDVVHEHGSLWAEHREWATTQGNGG